MNPASHPVTVGGSVPAVCIRRRRYAASRCILFLDQNARHRPPSTVHCWIPTESGALRRAPAVRPPCTSWADDTVVHGSGQLPKISSPAKPHLLAVEHVPALSGRFLLS